MKKLILVFLGFNFLFSFSACVTSNDEGHVADNQNVVAKNVILLIGDGMSYAQIQAAETILNKQLAMQSMPFTGNSTTYSADKLITDSGAAGTAIATGHKTNNGMIGMNADSTAVVSMLEMFADAGKKTAIAVSCGITHATPAAFVAKNINRNDYEAIAADFAATDKLDYFVGGGRNHFQKREDGQDLLSGMQENGWQFFDELTAVVPTSTKFGVFVADKHPASVLEGRGDLLPKATALLIKQMSAHENGFFLMIEGSQIDWAGHENDSAYLINEMADFDAAVLEALQFAKKDGETLVVVTSDHETGGLTLVNGPNKDYTRIRLHYSSGNHTSVSVPVFAYGPGAEYFTGVYDNIDIIDKVMKASGY
ncbi:MAG: alkaline phosphatase [Bacteroidetes bacterium]|jgi:alkaline phosphatase|nr:alkaline phosphatase [Bacteroidota bacterium]